MSALPIRSPAEVDPLLLGLVLTRVSPDWKAMELLRSRLLDGGRPGRARRLELARGAVEAGASAAALFDEHGQTQASASLLETGAVQLEFGGARHLYSPRVAGLGRLSAPLALRCAGLVGEVPPDDARQHDTLVVALRARYPFGASLPRGLVAG